VKRFLSDSETEVWKVWNRYGTLEPAWAGILPYLPYVPYLFSHAHTHMRVRARTRMHTHHFQYGRYGSMEESTRIRVSAFHTFKLGMEQVWNR
jgi:hypothetical protein